MPKPSRPATRLIVAATRRRAPGLVRVDFRSDDLSAFATSVCTDRYVKLVFPQPDGSEVVRTYTALDPVLDPDSGTGTLGIEFVVHGDEGVAGPWAAAAQPGEELLARGPGGAYAPSPEADWHLLAGDDSAIPAIHAALAALAETAPGTPAYAVIEVDGPADEVDLPLGEGIDVTFVHRGGAATGPGAQSPLVGAVRALTWREGRVHVFAHGEAEAVMHGIRPYVLAERGVAREDASISGYWRRGRTEEGFRAWKSELAAAESAQA